MEMTSREKDGYVGVTTLLFSVAVCLVLVHLVWFCHHLSSQLPYVENGFSLLARFYREDSLLANPLGNKLIILLLLLWVGAGAKGVIDPTLTKGTIVLTFVKGVLLYTVPTWLLYHKEWLTPTVSEGVYAALTAVALVYLVRAFQQAGRLFWGPTVDDVFNDENEEFPQNEQLLQNPDSLHFPYQYHFRGKWRTGYVNIINPFRSTMILGLPGSGKSATVTVPAIWQSMYKGYCCYVYDFKFPDLTEEAYNAWLHTIEHNPWAWTPIDANGRYTRPEPIIPTFWVINLDDLEYSHRCNPLTPGLMRDVIDAYESAQTIMLNLNKSWTQKQGDFFPESAINFLTAVIWYLRSASLYYTAQYEASLGNAQVNDKERLILKRLSEVCTFPHVLEFISKKYDLIFPVMEQYPEVETYIQPFLSALKGGAMEQLEGQIASVRIPISRLTSKVLYWVMSGNDFTLDLNNPDAPKIICTGNNPDREGIYSSAFSLYSSRLMRLVNKKGRLKSALFWDELPTIFLKGIDKLIATARSNRVAVWMAIQDFEQLIRDYGQQEAKVIINLPGNLFTGTVVYETAEKLAKRFGKTNQQKVSVTYSKQDTTMAVNTTLTDVIPPSKIATFKQGEFAGQYADNFGEEVDLKTFKGVFAIEKTHKRHKLPIITDIGPTIDATYDDLPAPYATLPPDQQETYKLRLMEDNFDRIKADIDLLLIAEVARFSLPTEPLSQLKNVTAGTTLPSLSRSL